MKKAAGPSLEDLRNRSSNDSRLQATRSNILNAATQLAFAQNPVTIKTIAEQAGISRGTFYAHFEGLDQLTLELLVTDLSTMSFSVENLVNHYVERRDVYRKSLQAGTSRSVLEGAVTATISALLQRVSAPNDRIQQLAIFTAWGYIGTLDSWLLSDDPAPKSEIISMLKELTPDELRGI